MKKWPAIVIGAVDAVLLTVILISLVTGWRIDAPKIQPDASDTQPIQSTVSSEQVQKDTGKATETPAQKVTENVTEKPAQPQTEAPKASYPSADEIGTSEYPTLADIQGFKWSSDKGAHWSVRTSTALELTDCDAVKSGWKAYLLDDPAHKRTDHSAERFANIRITGSEMVTKAIIDWFYVTTGEEGDGHDDTAPDSVFNGAWSDGAFSGTGSGKLTLNNFYYDNGKEYGTGAYT